MPLLMDLRPHASPRPHDNHHGLCFFLDPSAFGNISEYALMLTCHSLTQAIAAFALGLLEYHVRYIRQSRDCSAHYVYECVD